MTLIASFGIDKYHFLLGDLLLSNQRRPNYLINLPSIGNLDEGFYKRYKIYPKKICRKVCHFSNVALAWSGNYWESSSIIKDLFMETEDNGPICIDRLNYVLSNVDSDCKRALESGDVKLLGYFIDSSEGRCMEFGMGGSYFETSMFEDMVVAGSGIKLLKKHFASYKFDQPEEHSFETTLCTSLTFAGILLQLEIATKETILNHFGGGYEIIALTEDSIVISNNILIVFWLARVDQDGIKLSPFIKFFKNSYFDDILIIRTLEMKSPDRYNFAFYDEFEDKLYYAAPIYKDITREHIVSLPAPDFSACMLCSHILIESEKGNDIVSMFHWSPDQRLPIRIVSDDKEAHCIVQRDYIEQIIQKVYLRNL